MNLRAKQKKREAKFSCVILALTFYLNLTGFAVEAAEPVRISVTNQNISFLPAGVALKKGFFKDEGIDIDQVTQQLEDEAIVLFQKSYDELLQSINQKRESLAAR